MKLWIALGSLGWLGCEATTSPGPAPDSPRLPADSVVEVCAEHARTVACQHDWRCEWVEGACVVWDSVPVASTLGAVYEGTVDGERAWLNLYQGGRRVLGALSLDATAARTRLSGALRPGGQLMLGLSGNEGHEPAVWVSGQLDGFGTIRLGPTEVDTPLSDWQFEAAHLTPDEGFKPVLPTNLELGLAGTYSGGAHAFGDLGELGELDYFCRLSVIELDVDGVVCGNRADVPDTRWLPLVPDSFRYDEEGDVVGFLVEAGDRDVPVVGTASGGQRIDALVLRAGQSLDEAMADITAIPTAAVVGAMALTRD